MPPLRRPRSGRSHPLALVDMRNVSALDNDDDDDDNDDNDDDDDSESERREPAPAHTRVLRPKLTSVYTTPREMAEALGKIATADGPHVYPLAISFANEKDRKRWRLVRPVQDVYHTARANISAFLTVNHGGKHTWVGFFNGPGPRSAHAEEEKEWHSANWHCFAAAVVADASGRGKHLLIYDNDATTVARPGSRARNVLWGLQRSLAVNIMTRYTCKSIWLSQDPTYVGSGRCVNLAFRQVQAWAGMPDRPLDLQAARRGADVRTARSVELRPT